MFYDIFSKKNKKNKKITEIPIIIADIHEKNSMIISELHSSNEIKLMIKPLKIGDYLIGDIIIERKTVSDFYGSMINKRLIEQIKNMKCYPRQIIILEGSRKRLYDKKNPNALRGFIISITTSYQIPLIFTKDCQDTVQYLITLAKQQLKNKVPVSLHSRIPKTKEEQKKYILESFPDIGPITAEKLLKKFKTIDGVLNAGEIELIDILKSKVKKFKDILTS